MTTLDAGIPEGATCRPNFSAAGRRRRRSVAIGLTLFSVGVFAALVLLGAPAWARLLVALPAAAATAVGLQVTRNTCLAHAATGMTEHEDFSTTKADAAYAEVSRRVARTIYRDGLLVGAGVGLLAFASGWVT
ncbi:MAG: hypothetical protein INH41_06180 [Myxococcaceae bacterium]|jgi:hypothetical protein|nr:hypothetical protein [Myxococcaceae bacterium]MCA3011975.1 hypothetical protein [Myxococcaceae bacterium]